MAERKKEGDKHHYIPKFYLKQWVNSADPERRLCEFSRPYKIVKPRRIVTDGTGYEPGLYTFPNLPPHARDSIERKLLQMADDKADKVLQRILAGDMDFDQDARSAWSRFLMSLIVRNPEGITRLRSLVTERYPEYLDGLRDTFDSIKHPDDPRTFEDVKAKGTQAKDLEHIMLRLLQHLIDNPVVGAGLNNMVWGMVQFHRACFPLLTSDRPVIMTNGIGYPQSHIVLPISPNKVFIAATTTQQMMELDKTLKLPSAPQRLNDLVARQSRRYVYAADDRQLRFVNNRLGQALKSTPFD
jgi:hypothetical protein